MEALTFEKLPELVGKLFSKIEHIERMLESHPNPSSSPLTKYVDINGAAEITSKSPNALRIQICSGRLKSTKKGSRHYFEREYLEKWIAGEQN